MRKLALPGLMIALMVVGMVFVSTVHFSTVQASTPVSGVINTDTTWTKAKSPYILAGNVLVSNGVTLAIEAGTTINLKAYYIMVNGTLVAKGNSANQITFQGGNSYNGEIFFTESSAGWNQQTGLGSIIDNAFFNYTVINIEGGSAAILNNRCFASRISVSGGSPIISANDISGGKTVGFEVQYFTPVSVDGGSPLISNNYIHDGDIGIEIERGNPYVYGNKISACEPNIRANVGVIERNYFEGIIEIGNVTVKNNTVTSIEVRSSSSPTITYNNIVSIRLSSSTNVNAAYNWWETTITAEIQRNIWDFADDFKLGKVSYAPFLTEANPQAMPDPNAPIPTPNPYPSPTGTLTSNPSTSPTQNPTTPDQSGSGTKVMLGLDWMQVITVVLLGVIALLLVVVVMLLRKRS